MSPLTSSTTSKVYLDTCVLVSASVHGSYEDLDIELEHQFYAKTVPLFEIIKKNVDKRVGIITFTIETQAIAVIANAVATELEEKAESSTDPELRAKLFESHTVFFLINVLLIYRKTFQFCKGNQSHRLKKIDGIQKYQLCIIVLRILLRDLT